MLSPMSSEQEVSLLMNTMVSYFKHLFIVYGVDFLDAKNLMESKVFNSPEGVGQLNELRAASEAAIDELIKEQCEGITNSEVVAAYQS